MGARRAILQLAVLAAVLLAAVGVVVVLVVGDDTDGPGFAAAHFVDAWAAGDRDALVDLVVDPASLDATEVQRRRRAGGRRRRRS